MISREKLFRFYVTKKQSSQEIAENFHCSAHKVDYWLAKHRIPKRSISEAIYAKHNPYGDPFCIKKLTKLKDAFLSGLGLGLFWGEGNKKNKTSIRLGNTDPKLITKFIEFLVKIYGVNKKKLRFGLQVFSDMKAEEARDFWKRKLGISTSQFQKVIVTPARSLGTYRDKCKYGVLTVNFHNKKLRDILCNTIEKF